MDARNVEQAERTRWDVPVGTGDALVIVAKYPEPGAVKTRLGAVIGYQCAADLYRAFLTDLSTRFRRDPRASHYRLCWACAADRDAMTAVLYPGATIVPQRGEEFAERLFHVAQDMRRAGFRRLIISSADSPQLPASAIHRGFALLNSVDVVLGPTEDGGYYLIGLHLEPELPDLFRGIRMSTSKVLAQTVERAHERGLSVDFLATMFDVDEANDLVCLYEFLQDHRASLAPRTLAVLRQVAGTGWPAAASRSDVSAAQQVRSRTEQMG